MPSVGVQIESYLAQAEQIRATTTAERELAEQVRQDTKRLIEKKKELVYENLRITIGFCEKNGKFVRPFVAWYDFALGIRLVPLLISDKTVALQPWQTFKDKWYVVEQVASKRDLKDALLPYMQVLEKTKCYTAAGIALLHAVGLAEHLSGDCPTSDLCNYLGAHSALEDAEPADYLEDITDED